MYLSYAFYGVCHREQQREQEEEEHSVSFHGGGITYIYYTQYEHISRGYGCKAYAGGAKRFLYQFTYFHD